MEETKEDLRKGFQNEVLKVFILMYLSKHEGYPYALLKSVKEKHMWILNGLTKHDLYNTVNSLERMGFISGKSLMKGSVTQKHYVLAPKGKTVVKASKQMMINALKEVIKMMQAV